MFGFCAGLAIHSLLHATASAFHSSTRPRRWRTLAGVETAKHTHAMILATTTGSPEVGETRPPRGRERGSTQSANNSSKQATIGAVGDDEWKNGAEWTIPAQEGEQERVKDT